MAGDADGDWLFPDKSCASLNATITLAAIGQSGIDVCVYSDLLRLIPIFHLVFYYYAVMKIDERVCTVNDIFQCDGVSLVLTCSAHMTTRLVRRMV